MSGPIPRPSLETRDPGLGLSEQCIEEARGLPLGEANPLTLGRASTSFVNQAPVSR